MVDDSYKQLGVQRPSIGYLSIMMEIFKEDDKPRNPPLVPLSPQRFSHKTWPVRIGDQHTPISLSYQSSSATTNGSRYKSCASYSIFY